MIVSDNQESLWAWMNKRTGIPWSSDFRAIGKVAGDCLVCAAAYNGFVARVCFMHIAVDDKSSFDRSFIRAILHYPLVVCKLDRVLVLVEETENSCSIARRCGFKEQARMQGAGRSGGDLFLLGATATDCEKYLGAQNVLSLRVRPPASA